MINYTFFLLPVNPFIGNQTQSCSFYLSLASLTLGESLRSFIIISIFLLFHALHFMHAPDANILFSTFIIKIVMGENGVYFMYHNNVSFGESFAPIISNNFPPRRQIMLQGNQIFSQQSENTLILPKIKNGWSILIFVQVMKEGNSKE